MSVLSELYNEILDYIDIIFKSEEHIKLYRSGEQEAYILRNGEVDHDNPIDLNELEDIEYEKEACVD